jgi:hypothetical protein
MLSIEDIELNAECELQQSNEKLKKVCILEPLLYFIFFI